MELPTVAVPVARLGALSRFAANALRRYGEVFEVDEPTRSRLQALATTITESFAALDQAASGMAAAENVLAEARVVLKLVDLKVDETIRSVKRSADDAGEQVSSAVFPTGTLELTRAAGMRQLAVLKALTARVEAASGWKDRDEQLARLRAVSTAFEAALQGRQTAEESLGTVRARRNAARQDVLTTFARVAGAVKELFPRQRERQDLFFDAVSEPVRPVVVDDDPDDVPADG